MKKISLLIIFLLLITACGSNANNDTDNLPEEEVIIFTKGLGKSTSEYVKNIVKIKTFVVKRIFGIFTTLRIN